MEGIFWTVVILALVGAGIWYFFLRDKDGPYAPGNTPHKPLPTDEDKL